ncbi:MAG: 50S ribosomal protein L29 [Simkaniaceae bacterium]|nr:50S ribosomal protein L29 [Simkaniaceae bacterium]
MLKAKDLLSESVEELEARYEELSKNIFELVNRLRLERKLERPHLIGEYKRDRARVLTVLHRKRAAGV